MSRIEAGKVEIESPRCQLYMQVSWLGRGAQGRLRSMQRPGKHILPAIFVFHAELITLNTGSCALVRIILNIK